MEPLITYLVEDNPTILEHLVDTLEEITDIQITAHSGSEAEAIDWLALHEGAWHLAIVDLFLKQGSGLGVLAGCRDRKPYQKMVVLSNYATPQIRLRATALGADAVFDKSTELEGLIDFCMRHTAQLRKAAI